MTDQWNMDTNAYFAGYDQQDTVPVDAVSVTALTDIQIKLDPVLFQRLYDAALTLDGKDCAELIDDAVMRGVEPEHLADHYIPALARQMGDEWCKDQLGFARVTIGVSRLQSMLRELGPEWISDQTAGPDSASILLVVLQDAHHTLGAMVLAGQLRRSGLSVRLLLDANRYQVKQQMAKTRYDAAFISCSQSETLESLRRMVDVIRKSKAELPIVVGGSLLEIENSERVVACTGASYATQFPYEALEYCGLTVATRPSAVLAKRI